jgi:hypothetical protein|tara:strand:- start:13948 stop:14130 length:183 start_codon:yes stop_codon:yes gene_type:complete
MNNTAGRFFGIEKRDGSKINAQLVSETSNYVTVNDRNAGTHKKLAKASIVGLNIDGEIIR